MADNLTTTTTVSSVPDATPIATDKVTYSGDALQNIAPTSLVHIHGAEGSKTTSSVSKLEDDAHTSGDAGIVALAVQKTTGAAIAGTDGDYTPLQTDANGNLRVAIATVAANSSVKQDDAVFTPATDYVAVIGAQADETGADSVSEGDAGALRMTLDRLLKVTNELESSYMRIGGVSVVPKFSYEAVTASDTDEELIALVSAKKLRVLALTVIAGGTATDVTFESSTTTAKFKVTAGANGGVVLPFNPVGWFETASGESLTVTTGAGSTVQIATTYIEV